MDPIIGADLAPPGAEVVEDRDLVAALQEGPDEVMADEAGTARDEDAHVRSPLPDRPGGREWRSARLPGSGTSSPEISIDVVELMKKDWTR